MKSFFTIILKIILSLYGFYFALMSVALFFTYLTKNQFYQLLNLIISLPSLFVLFLFIFNRNMGNKKMWKIYAVVFVIYDFIHNFVILPFVLKTHTFNETLSGLPILLPIYIVLFYFTFKKRSVK